MDETSKSQQRREQEGFFDRYCQGKGLDIGCGKDPLAGCRGWDKADGDAQELAGLEVESFDFVYSSHCLEHMRDPRAALARWWAVVKPGGYLIVVVPDARLYEQGIWPPVWNPDHKGGFSISRYRRVVPVHYNLTELVRDLVDHEVVYFKVVDQGLDYSKVQTEPYEDQTLGNAEAAIEMVVRKMQPKEYIQHYSCPAVVKCGECESGRIRLEGLHAGYKIAGMCEECGWRFTGKLPELEDTNDGT